MHAIASQAIVGRRRLCIPIPVWSAKMQAATLPNVLIGFNRDQVIMSQEDNTCDPTKFTHDFGWTPRAFEDSLREYAPQL
ncbi:MAG: hypothetical protein ACREJC_13270, partial [Tepidisphaeraceae bacterium]